MHYATARADPLHIKQNNLLHPLSHAQTNSLANVLYYYLRNRYLHSCNSTLLPKFLAQINSM